MALSATCLTPCTCTLLQTLVMVESVQKVEQAYKTLDLIAKHLENRAGQDVDDCESSGRLGVMKALGKEGRLFAVRGFASLGLGLRLRHGRLCALAGHHRKKYYMRLCERAMRMERGSDVVFAIFGNLQRFQVSTYFAKEVIERLGELGVHPGLLFRIADLNKLQRGAADKGVRAAYTELVRMLEARGQEADLELLPKAKAELKALRSGPVVKLVGSDDEAPAPTPATAAPIEVKETTAL